MRRELATNRHTHPHQQTNGRATIRHFPQLGGFTKTELPQPDAFGAVRTDRHDAQLFAATGAGQGERAIGHGEKVADEKMAVLRPSRNTFFSLLS
jgi:hypothetical protein